MQRCGGYFKIARRPARRRTSLRAPDYFTNSTPNATRDGFLRCGAPAAPRDVDVGACNYVRTGTGVALFSDLPVSNTQHDRTRNKDLVLLKARRCHLSHEVVPVDQPRPSSASCIATRHIPRTGNMDRFAPAQGE